MSSSSRIIGLGGLIKESTEGESKEYAGGDKGKTVKAAPTAKKGDAKSKSKSYAKPKPKVQAKPTYKAPEKKSPPKKSPPKQKQPPKKQPPKQKKKP